MKRIDAYQTDDGLTFECADDARRHEAKVGLYALLDEHGVCNGGAWNAEMVADTIIENIDEFVRALHAVQEEI